MTPENHRLRISKAFSAMKVLGIGEDKVKPVLKKLLKLYDKNWAPIEEESYRVLADTIFEEEEENTNVSKPNRCEQTDHGKNLEEESVDHGELEQPLKRRMKSQGAVGSSPSHTDLDLDGPLLKRHKVEGERSRTSSQLLTVQGRSDQYQSRGSEICAANKGKEPVSTQVSLIKRKHSSGRVSQALRIKDHIAINEQRAIALPKQKETYTLDMVIPKNEPFTDDTLGESLVPVAVIHPGSTIGRTLKRKPAGPTNQEHLVLPNVEKGSRNDAPKESPRSLDIASSPLGEVEISISCSADIARKNFHMPSLDQIKKSMEEKCLRSYRILDPTFSFTKLMQDTCQCVLELATKPSQESHEGLLNPTPTPDLLKKSARHALDVRDKMMKVGIPSSANEMAPRIPLPLQRDNILGNDNQMTKEIVVNGHVGSDEKKSKDPEVTNSSSLVVVPQCDLNLYESRCIHDVKDITKGQERLEISWVNELTDEWLPSFRYMPENIVFKNASAEFPLSRIGDANCCFNCIGDCLTSTGSCACAHENGGEFAYTSEGLLKDEVLNERIRMTLKVRNYHFCKESECPIEKLKRGDAVGACEGHKERNLIKECWLKCGCFKQCGNRVVQRGITHKLQVFYTAEGKGWGLRTLDKIPRGAFVCEFVGEILTISELFERKLGNTDPERYSCPVLLDAFWGSKEVLKDEEALCLDATCYGNIARFINHRCFDANLIEIPVEIETPDHHYYHLAFFTTREVDALEELTWDYGIQFGNRDHLVKAFQCQCGSEFCRKMTRPMKRLKRAKSSITR